MIAGGVAVEHIKGAEHYINQIFRAAFKNTIPDLHFVGSARVTPEKELEEITRMRGSKRLYDVAPSNIYMMKYMFRYKGKDLEPRHINLPFVKEAGTITLSGSRFLISPVLADPVISIDLSTIFIRLLKDRVTFERVNQHFMVNNQVDSAQVAWSIIHHGAKRSGTSRSSVKAYSTLVHYLFCKYGFTETFRRFGNCQAEIGGAEINEDSHPPDKWMVCSSVCQARQIKPPSYPKGFYQPTELRIAIRKDSFTPMVKNMVAGFFYVADYYPEMLQQEHINSNNTWYVIMGKILWPDEENYGKLYNDVANHIVSLDSYLDEINAKKLRSIHVQVDNIYDMFAVVIDNFNDWLLSNADKINSMYGKELSVLYYVLFPITSAIFNLAFKLEASSKNELTEKEISSTMAHFLKPGLIFDITSGHGEISTVNYSGDNMALKPTTILVPQTATNKRNGKNGDKSMANDPTKQIHMSVVEFGGYSNQPKSDPSGRGRINPMALVDPVSNMMQRNPALMQLLDDTQKLLEL